MEKIKTFSEAFLEAQIKIQQQPRQATGTGPFKGKDGSSNNFLPLKEVYEIVVPIVNEFKFILTQKTQKRDDNFVYLVTELEYSLTSEVRELSAFPYGMAGIPATMQALGSEETYLKRRQLCTIFCIHGEKDDDGQAASTPIKQVTKVEVLTKEQANEIKNLLKDKPEIKKMVIEKAPNQLIDNIEQKYFKGVIQFIEAESQKGVA